MAVRVDETGANPRLQKASPEAQRAAGAVDEQGRILIDTGLLFFDVEQTRRLAGLAGCSARPSRKAGGLQDRFAQQIDLYEDMTAALASGTDRKTYLANPATSAMRAELWKVLHSADFRVMRLDGQFLHLGTTRQFRDACRPHAPGGRAVQQNVLAHTSWKLARAARVYQVRSLAQRANRPNASSSTASLAAGAGRRGRSSASLRGVSHPCDLGATVLSRCRAPRQGPCLRPRLCGWEDDLRRHATALLFPIGHGEC